MKKVMLDSSVWLSYILKDSNFAKAKRLLKKIITYEQSLIVPDLVLAEIINTLNKKQYSVDFIFKVINQIKAIKNIKMIKFDLSQISSEILEKTRLSNLKSLDFLIICYALVYQVRLFYTYDIKQHHAYEKISKK